MPRWDQLFYSMDPFDRYPPWVVKEFPGFGFSVEIRPLYLSIDLKSLYRWQEVLIDASGDKTKWEDRLFFHYCELIESEEGQSFMILLDGIRFCQVDLRNMEVDTLYGKIKSVAGDVIIDVLVGDRTEDAEKWQAVTEMLYEKLASFEGLNRIFIRIPNYPAALQAILLRAGWKSHETELVRQRLFYRDAGR